MKNKKLTRREYKEFVTPLMDYVYAETMKWRKWAHIAKELNISAATVSHYKKKMRLDIPIEKF